jgi:hypothetical protein
MLISSLTAASSPAADAIDNTLYFNVSGSVDQPDYTSLVNDLMTIWAARQWSIGRFIDIRAYNMDDATPRPIKARATQQVTGTAPSSPRQVALCLSYYADRNLPRQRGRIYLGPWATPGTSASAAQLGQVIGLAPALAGLGGLNVDWSIYSPTRQAHDAIKHAWVDDSWDIVRSRKMPQLNPRQTWDGNG